MREEAVRRGILLGLCLGVVLAVAAVLLIVRGGGSPSAPPAAAVARAMRPPVAPEPPAKARPETARFDIVTVAPDGTAVIAGRAAPGALVQVFDGGRKLGEVAADRRGEWVLVPDRPLAGGRRRLRLRATLKSGPVLASAETVAVTVPRAPPAAAAPDRPALPAPLATAGSYVVQRGNTLWRIARRFLGSGLRYLNLYSANRDQIRNPDLIYPGQVVKLPGKS